MTRYIQINVDYGRPESEDIERARAAAEAVIARGGTHEEAEKAADLALTKGWADPDGASCSTDVTEVS